MPKKIEENKEKFELLNKLLDDEFILAHIDCSASNVTLPESLKEQKTVTLKFSRLFRGGIEISEEGIESNLLFNNKYFLCKVPLKAIWGVTSYSGSNTIWPESTPKHILKDLVERAKKDGVKKSLEEKEQETEVKKDRPAKEIKRGHLKLIK